jgi:hypothetical protein
MHRKINTEGKTCLKHRISQRLALSESVGGVVPEQKDNK